MKSFHGDIKIKRKYVSRLKAHHKADQIIQGITFENGRGGLDAGGGIRRLLQRAYSTP